MPDYKQSTETGTKWRRAFHVDIENPFEGDKKIIFHAEDCIQLADGAVMHDRHGITYAQAFTPGNADTEFPLGLHPVTGEDMGAATYMQAYLLLSALFVAIASAQDAATGVPPEMPE